MRKFVGLADDKGIERIACIELVVAALKIQLGLLPAGNHRRRMHRFFFRADVLYLYVWSTELVKDGLNDLAVGARQDLPEDGAGNLYKERVALGAVQPRGLEPRRVGVRADPGLHPLEEFFPRIRCFALPPNLSSSGHRRRKKTLCHFHRCEKAVESILVRVFLQTSEFCLRRNVMLSPCRPPRGPSGIVCPRTAAMRQRGIVSDWHVGSKRKVREGIHRCSHLMHSFSTSKNLCCFS